MKIETSRFVSLLEEKTGNKVGAVSRMVDSLTKATCKECKSGNVPGHRTTCEVRIFWQSQLTWSRAGVLPYLKEFTPNTLASIIQKANQEYWFGATGHTTLSDTEYDLVVERLKFLDEEHPQLNKLC